MRNWTVALLVLALGACSKPSSPVYRDEAPLGKPPAPAADAAVGVERLAPPPNNAPQPVAPSGQPMLAYSYSFGLEVSPKSVKSLAARHEAACTAAGPNVCQMISSDVREFGRDQVRATLTLRAAPAWLSPFRQGLSGDARAAGGRVVSTSVESEDLSRQIVDTEAALRARTTLRDRLQQILATRPGKVADLVEVERELAKVQGEIDATQSELTQMKGRVAMSDVTLNYESRGVLAPQGLFSPLGRAFADTLSMVVASLAFMVRLIAVLLPWAAVAFGLLWLFRKPLTRWRERRRARRAARDAERRPA